jgi:hypothetical protein
MYICARAFLAAELFVAVGEEFDFSPVCLRAAVVDIRKRIAPCESPLTNPCNGSGKGYAFKALASGESVPRYIGQLARQLNAFKAFAPTTGVKEVMPSGICVDDRIYDMGGRNLSAVPQHGVYIRGNEKFMSKEN